MELWTIIEATGIQFVQEDGRRWRWGIPGVFAWSRAYASKEEALAAALRMIVYKACLYQALEIVAHDLQQRTPS